MGKVNIEEQHLRVTHNCASPALGFSRAPASWSSEDDMVRISAQTCVSGYAAAQKILYTALIVLHWKESCDKSEESQVRQLGSMVVVLYIPQYAGDAGGFDTPQYGFGISSCSRTRKCIRQITVEIEGILRGVNVHTPVA